jgi:hypothetical protein
MDLPAIALAALTMGLALAAPSPASEPAAPSAAAPAAIPPGPPPPPAQPTPADGAESSAAALLSAPASAEAGSPSVSEFGLVFSGVSLSGSRIPPGRYLPAFPLRVPALNDAGAADSPGLTLRLDHRLDRLPGRVAGQIQLSDTNTEVIYANGDPLLARVGGNPVMDALNRRGDGDGSGESPPPVLLGRFDPAGAALVFSRVTRVSGDLAYGGALLGSWPLSLSAAAGARLAVFYQEDRSQGLGVETFASTHFLGAGPLLRAELVWAPAGDRRRPGASWSLYARAEGGELFGRVRQSYREAVSAPYPAGYADARDEEARTVPTLQAEGGVSFRLSGELASMRVGFRFDRWWGVGGIGPSRFDLTARSLVVLFAQRF